MLPVYFLLLFHGTSVSRTYMLNISMDFYEWNHSTRFSSDRDILSSVNSTVLMSLATLIWLYWTHVLLKYAVPSISVCSPLFARSHYCLVELQGSSFSPLNATLHCWKFCAESLKNNRSEGSLSFMVAFLLNKNPFSPLFLLDTKWKMCAKHINSEKSIFYKK